MSISCKYMGQTEYYNKADGFEPMYIEYGHIYDIVYTTGVGKYKYVIYIIDRQGQIITWIPYDVNPFIKHWLFIR